MVLKVANDYMISHEAEAIMLLDAGIVSIGNAIKARCAKVIKDNPGPAKDYIIAEAKRQGYTIKAKDISNIKVESVNGKEENWGLKFLDFQIIDDTETETVLFLYDEEELNDKDTPDTTHFGYKKDITDSTTWTIKGGFTIKGGTAIFKGWEVRFDVTYETVHSETQEFTWSKDIELPANSITEIDACLKQQLGTVQVKAPWQVTKGTVHCSCDIRYCGTQHRTADIPITDILSTEALQTLVAYGTFDSKMGLHAIVATHSRPIP